MSEREALFAALLRLREAAVAIEAGLASWAGDEKAHELSDEASDTLREGGERCPEMDAWGLRCDLKKGHPGLHEAWTVDDCRLAFGKTVKTNADHGMRNPQMAAVDKVIGLLPDYDAALTVRENAALDIIGDVQQLLRDGTAVVTVRFEISREQWEQAPGRQVTGWCKRVEHRQPVGRVVAVVEYEATEGLAARPLSGMTKGLLSASVPTNGENGADL